MTKTTAKSSGVKYTRMINRARRCVECTALFATGEAYRDHLPCSGKMSPELIEYRKTNLNPVIMIPQYERPDLPS